eukprot:TRINITY_DN6901_c1_g1_i1.p1 TRINITY_DN6901_c1_g1~~TRINITY_DN6901_c1_g1_i1.p1  ORF type:complete len:115 (-),score=8.48 TRINITY_DN6901_c1_g1_i1:64-408(-)
MRSATPDEFQTQETFPLERVECERCRESVLPKKETFPLSFELMLCLSAHNLNPASSHKLSSINKGIQWDKHNIQQTTRLSFVEHFQCTRTLVQLTCLIRGFKVQDSNCGHSNKA